MLHPPSGEVRDHELAPAGLATAGAAGNKTSPATDRSQSWIFFNFKIMPEKNRFKPLAFYGPSSITEASTAPLQEGTMPSRMSSPPVNVFPSCGIGARPGAGLSS